jgi:hypothetical protein
VIPLIFATKSIMSVVSPVGKGAGRAAVAVGMVFAAIGIGLWAFACYLGALVKAKKSKACPYLKFKDEGAL